MRWLSPLRYPGGKASLFPLVCEILRENDLSQPKYFEPYAGGGGLGLSLLVKGLVSEIHLNDFDRSIWAFWHTVVNDADRLVAAIDEVEVSIETWKKMRQIQANKEESGVFELALSTFFLNRTNVSGVISGGGVIGGLKQNGNYKIDCRFNKKELSQRILKIHKYRNRIKITNFDAVEFIELNSSVINGFFYIDPPYFEKGPQLYTNSYSKSDHAGLSERFKELDCPWLLTYDDVEGIRALYEDVGIYEISVGYSLWTKRIGREVAIISKYLKPSELLLRAA